MIKVYDYSIFSNEELNIMHEMALRYGWVNIQKEVIRECVNRLEAMGA
jgi:hypothetical protein